jgi:hypothetical protein
VIGDIVDCIAWVLGLPWFRRGAIGCHRLSAQTVSDWFNRPCLSELD